MIDDDYFVINEVLNFMSFMDLYKSIFGKGKVREFCRIVVMIY